MLSLYAWALIFIVPVCVLAETHRFLAIPPARQKVELSSNLTINCTTNNAKDATAVYFRKSKRPSSWRKLTTQSDSLASIEQQVYMLTSIKRQYHGQFQCRAWQMMNGTDHEITWPLNVGKVIIIKRKKPEVNKKPTDKKKNKGKKGKQKPGNKKTKKQQKSKKKGKPSPTKRWGKNKKTKKQEKSKKKGKPSPTKRWGKNKKKSKKERGKKKSVLVSLKSPKTSVNASNGDNITLNCIAKHKSRSSQTSVSWYKDGKIISNPHPSHISVARQSIHYSRQKILLKINGFKESRDKGKYECRATDSNGKVLKSLFVTVY